MTTEMQVVTIAIGLSIVLLGVIACGALVVRWIATHRERKAELRVLAQLGIPVAHHPAHQGHRR